jgi:hypothetical protein
MRVSQRSPTDSDWPSILDLANAALPWDTIGNKEWLENRKQFTGRRRHYVAEETPSGPMVAYGAIEEGPDPGIFRVFVVMNPALLETTTGDLVYERLAADLAELAARGAWVREYASDTAILAFFTQRGFVERSRFAPSDRQEMVVLVKPFEESN